MTRRDFSVAYAVGTTTWRTHQPRRLAPVTSRTLSRWVELGTAWIPGGRFSHFFWSFASGAIALAHAGRMALAAPELQNPPTHFPVRAGRVARAVTV